MWPPFTARCKQVVPQSSAAVVRAPALSALSTVPRSPSLAASSSAARSAPPSPSCPCRATFMDPHATLLRLARGLPGLRLMGARSESVGWRRLPAWTCHAAAPGPQHATAHSPHSKLVVDGPAAHARRCCMYRYDRAYPRDAVLIPSADETAPWSHRSSLQNNRAGLPRT